MTYTIGGIALVITLIMLGATVYSLKYEDKPLLLKPKYKKRH